jgi:hypothetical protein
MSYFAAPNGGGIIRNDRNQEVANDAADGQDVSDVSFRWDGQIVSFHALTQYWITSGRGIRANAAPGTKYHLEKKASMPVGAGRTCCIFFAPFVFATTSGIAGLISP